jgi:hypothetical protein
MHPVPSQRSLVLRIMHDWREGFGARYNDTRRQAFERLSLCSTLSEAVEAIQQEWGGLAPEIVVTGASRFTATIGFSEMRQRLGKTKRPCLLLFGTGWGLSENIASEADHVLEPIRGAGEYNHLSVRSAVAIMADRLVGGQ